MVFRRPCKDCDELFLPRTRYNRLCPKCFEARRQKQFSERGIKK